MWVLWGCSRDFGVWVPDFEPQLLTIFLSICNSSSPMKIAECRSLNFHTNGIIIVHLATVGHKIPAESFLLLLRLLLPLSPHTTTPTRVFLPHFDLPLKLDCQVEMMPVQNAVGADWRPGVPKAGKVKPVLRRDEI